MSPSDQTRCSPKSYAPFLPTKHLNKRPADGGENVASKDKPKPPSSSCQTRSGDELDFFPTFLQAAESLWKCGLDSVTGTCEWIMSERHRHMTPDTEEQVGVYSYRSIKQRPI